MKKVLRILKELNESFWLFVANHLPRISILDKYRYVFLKLAGFKIKGKATIWSGIDIRPIGCAVNVEIGSGTFINKNL